jgi:hypothetical protein
MLQAGEQSLLEAGIVKQGDTIVVMAGEIIRAWFVESQSLYTRLLGIWAHI